MTELEFRRTENILEKMDRTTPEFLHFYKIMNRKYFTFENPDAHQMAARTLNTVINVGKPWFVAIVAKIANAVYSMTEKNFTATSGEFTNGDASRTIYFKFYDTPEAADKLQKIVTNRAIVESGKTDES